MHPKQNGELMANEAKDIFEAASRSVQDLLTESGSGFYIPAYQRPYGWDKTKVTKLLDDTLHGLNVLLETKDSYTFLGSIITILDQDHVTVHPIVKDQVPARVLTVIDGQQRLCSLTLLCVALHNRIAVSSWSIFGGSEPTEDKPAYAWMYNQALTLMAYLGLTFYEVKPTGDSPTYPRIIRAFSDQWSKKSSEARYASPIANLVHTYASSISAIAKPGEFRPKVRDLAIDGTTEASGESDLIARYNEIRKALTALARGDDSEEYEGVPDLVKVAGASSFQRALFNHEFSDELRAEIAAPAEEHFLPLLRMLLLASYVLNRVALTMVRGKNEDYAFTIFESLNTTGEPLTAFETFKPRVVSNEGLEHYGTSESRKSLEEVEGYLGKFKVGAPLQTATTNFLVTFALSETGTKLSKRLSDQRSYLRQEFDRHANSPTERLAFLNCMRDVSSFVDSAWNGIGPDTPPALKHLPASASTDSFKLCMTFLRNLNHSIAISPLSRFYSSARQGTASETNIQCAQLDKAAQAISAFSILWRASRRTTGNIDREYRQIMSGTECLALSGPLARTASLSSSATPALVDVEMLKRELRARLLAPEHGAILDRESWVKLANALPLYQVNSALTRILLLAAYHDAAPDHSSLGLIMKAKPGSASFLTFVSYVDDRHLTIEHIAPQSGQAGWDASLYQERDTVHRIGNLVLAPLILNSSFGNRPWVEKRVLFGALGASTHSESEALIESAKSNNIKFAMSTDQLVQESHAMPQLVALAQRTEDWSIDFVDERGARLLELAWDRLWPWLQPEG